MKKLLIWFLNNVGFESFIGHDHYSVPGNIDEECDWETPIKCNESLFSEHIVENADVSLRVKQLAPLFDAVERSHD